jgi:hypothetical protein
MKLTKLSILLSLLLITKMVTAATIVEHTTSNVEGGLYEKDGKTLKTRATDCLYAVTDDPYDRANVQIFINSDERANTNFGFRIPRSAVPLKNGKTIKGGSGFEVIYEAGVLTAKRVKEDGVFSSDTDLIKIKVSTDLMKVKEATGVTTLGSLVRSKKFKELKCVF